MNRPADPAAYAAYDFADTLELRPLRWLWPGRIPLGQVTLLVGDPDVGKSLLVADLVARLCTARLWPDEQPAPPPPLPPREGPGEGSSTAATLLPPGDGLPAFPLPPREGSGEGPPVPTFPPSHVPTAPRSLHLPFAVLMACPEDPHHEVLLPRLAVAGADLSHICLLRGVRPGPLHPQFVNRAVISSLDPTRPLPSDIKFKTPVPLVLPDHANHLEEAIRAVSTLRLVVLDSLNSLCSRAAQADPAELMATLGDIARRRDVAILALGHLTKSRSLRVLYRVRGSLTFVAAARAVYLLSADPDQPARRVLSTVKCNLGPPPPPLAYRVTPGPRLVWENPGSNSPTPGRAPWQRADLIDLPPESYSALAEACTWLTEYLACGPQPARQLLRDSRLAGLAPTTLRRAKRVLGVRAVIPEPGKPWIWQAPITPDNTCPTAEISRDDQIGVQQK